MSRHIVAPWELALLDHQLEALFDALARPAEASTGGWTPAIDLLDRGDAFLARVDLPGVATADVEVVLDERELRVAGVKRPHKGGAQRRCHRVERSFGPFALHVHLPSPVAVGACRAILRGGVLEITLPRPDPSARRPRRVEVSEEEP